LGWVRWFNSQRLHTNIGYVAPVEYENEYYGQNPPAQQPLSGQRAVH
jgi:hypothetical protein